MKLETQKVSSMAYRIWDEDNNEVGYVKKTGYQAYRLTINDEYIGTFNSVESCVARLVKRLESV